MGNREILFRGIRTDNRKWVEGIPIESNIHGGGYETFMYTDYTVHNAISLVVGGGYFGRCVEIIPQSVVQFTGLLDKNGKKIFEGDKVKRDSVNKYAGGGGEYIIEWNGGYAMLGLSYGNADFPTDYHNRFYKIMPKKIEVIGSIYDYLLEENNGK